MGGVSFAEYPPAIANSYWRSLVNEYFEMLGPETSTTYPAKEFASRI